MKSRSVLRDPADGPGSGKKVSLMKDAAQAYYGDLSGAANTKQARSGYLENIPESKRIEGSRRLTTTRRLL